MFFKFCANCNTKAPRLARVCKPCGGKAVWRAPTCEEITAAKAKSDRMEEILQAVLREEASEYRYADDPVATERWEKPSRNDGDDNEEAA